MQKKCKEQKNPSSARGTRARSAACGEMEPVLSVGPDWDQEFNSLSVTVSAPLRHFSAFRETCLVLGKREKGREGEREREMRLS